MTHNSVLQFMRIITFLTLILISSNFFSQSSQIDINWVGNEQYNIAGKSLIVPKSEDFKNLYFVGAGCHPGAGVPGVISSAKVLENILKNESKES